MPIDWEFIAACEGKDIAVGYMPMGKNGKVLGKSGLTIGTGFDIGNHSETEIDQLEIPESLKAKLRPFTAGKSKNVLSLGTLLGTNKYHWPKATLMQHKPGSYLPLNFGASFGAHTSVIVEVEPALQLDKTELAELSAASRKQASEPIIRRYNRAAHLNSHTAVSFDDLPSPIQTAIISFCFQFGPNVGAIPLKTDRRRAYWDALVSQDWALAINLLDTRFLDYRDRRLKEMRLIQKGAAPLPPALVMPVKG